MFGLMAVWLMTRFPGFLLLERGALPFGFVGFGLAGIGGHWDDDVGALFLGLCRLFRELSFVVLFLLFRLMTVSILGLTIWGSFVM